MYENLRFAADEDTYSKGESPRISSLLTVDNEKELLKNGTTRALYH